MERIDITKGMNDGEDLEIPKVENISKYNYSSNSFLCFADGITEDELKTLSILKEVLKKSGIDLRVTHYVDEYFEEEKNGIYISFKEKKVAEKITRNAGRKKDYSMFEKYKECTVSELKTKLDSGMKKSEIIAELRCPKATFYRILKNIEKIDVLYTTEPDEMADHLNRSIWLYTS